MEPDRFLCKARRPIRFWARCGVSGKRRNAADGPIWPTEGRLSCVIIVPQHISEKATIVADDSEQFVFKVSTDATKLEIKKAVELLFKVDVKAVRVANVKGKRKMNRFGFFRKPSWKKAYVRLAQGQDIDFAAVE